MDQLAWITHKQFNMMHFNGLRFFLRTVLLHLNSIYTLFSTAKNIKHFHNAVITWTNWNCFLIYQHDYCRCYQSFCGSASIPIAVWFYLIVIIQLKTKNQCFANDFKIIDATFTFRLILIKLILLPANYQVYKVFPVYLLLTTFN